MKKLNFLFLIFVIFIGCNLKDSQTDDNNSSKKIADIKTISTEEITYDDICFMVEASSYPQIEGLDDSEFQKKLNDILITNYNFFVEDTKKNESGCIEIEGYEDDPLSKIPTSISTYFEVLTNNENMISIVQYFYVIPGGGGNMYYIFSKTLNADLKNKMLIDNNSFAFSNEKIGKINRQLVDYFNNAFPEEVEYLNYPEIEKSKNEEYNIAFKNDSLVLVIEAYPSAHYTYQTYIVPIEKFVLK